MKRIIVLCLTIFTFATTWSKDGDTFVAKSVEGIDVLYQIISETDKTVRVGREAVTINDPAYTVSIDKSLKGPLTIPATVNGYRVVELGIGAFYNCALVELKLTEGLERINSPFLANSNLRRVNIPSTVNYLYASFAACNALEELVVPEKVTDLYSTIFQYSGIKSLTLPSGLTEIRNQTLSNNSSLSGLFLNSSTPPKVESGTFSQSNYTKTVVYVPESSLSAYQTSEPWCNFANLMAPRAEGDVFKWTDKTGLEFEFKVISAADHTVQIGSGNGPAISTSHSGNINLPTYAYGYRVAGIAADAFTACTGITAVTADFDYPMAFPVSAFPSSLYTDGYLYVPEDFRQRYAELSCWSAFKNVNTPEIYEYERGDYFVAKTAEGIDMTFYVTDAKRKYVRVYRSEYDSEVEHSYVHNVISKDTEGPVTIPDFAHGYKVVEIGNFAFQKCKKITSVHIPDAVTQIGQDAFLGCTGLITVNLPSALTRLRDGAFYACSNLTGTMFIPEGVTSLERETFAYCSSLSGVVFSKNLTTIEEGAFAGNAQLTSFTIPASVTSIGSGAFKGCENLKGINVEAGNMSYDSRNNCNAIVQTSTNQLIQGAINTVIPESVTSIGKDAFNGVDLSVVEIPENVVIVESGAYKNCSNIGRVFIHGCPELGYNAFGSVPETCQFFVYSTTPPVNSYAVSDKGLQGTLYVPRNSIEAYKAADCWKDFANILPIEDVVAISSAAINHLQVKTEGSSITVCGLTADGTSVNVFTIDGRLAGSAVSHSGRAVVQTTLLPGTLAIVKSAGQAVRVVIR